MLRKEDPRRRVMPAYILDDNFEFSGNQLFNLFLSERNSHKEEAQNVVHQYVYVFIGLLVITSTMLAGSFSTLERGSSLHLMSAYFSIMLFYFFSRWAKFSIDYFNNQKKYNTHYSSLITAKMLYFNIEYKLNNNQEITNDDLQILKHGSLLEKRVIELKVFLNSLEDKITKLMHKVIEFNLIAIVVMFITFFYKVLLNDANIIFSVVICSIILKYAIFAVFGEK